MSNYKWTLTLNTEQLRDHVDTVLEDVVEELADEFTATIESPVFAWGTVTHRRNGSVVSDPRDAVDTGNMRDSLETNKLRPGLYQLIWQADYTKNVFNQAIVDLIPFTLERFKSDTIRA